MLLQREVSRIKNIHEEAGMLPGIFDALGDPTRFRIFKILMEEKDVCVTDLANILGISLPATSQQLRILEGAGLVISEKTGQTVCYYVKDGNPIVRSIIKLVTSNQ